MELLNLVTLEAQLATEYDKLRKYLSNSTPRMGSRNSSPARTATYYKSKISVFRSENDQLAAELAQIRQRRTSHSEKLHQLGTAISEGQRSSSVQTIREKQLTADLVQLTTAVAELDARKQRLATENEAAAAAVARVNTQVEHNVILLREKEESVRGLLDRRSRVEADIAHHRARDEALSKRLAEAGNALRGAEASLHHTQLSKAQLAQMLSRQQQSDQLVAERDRLGALYSDLIEAKSLYLAQYKRKVTHDRQARILENLRAIESLEQLAADKLKEVMALR